MQRADIPYSPQKRRTFTMSPITTKRTAIPSRSKSSSSSRNCASGSGKNVQPTCRSHTTSAGRGIFKAATATGSVSCMVACFSIRASRAPAKPCHPERSAAESKDRLKTIARCDPSTARLRRCAQDDKTASYTRALSAPRRQRHRMRAMIEMKASSGEYTTPISMKSDESATRIGYALRVV